MTKHEICVHDAEILSYQVDILKKTIDLKVDTANLPCNCHSWLAIVSFSWVEAHEFLNVNSYQNSIYEIYKEDIEDYIKYDKDDLKQKISYGFFPWPNNLEELKKYLIENNLFIFKINSSIWLYWTVLAKEMKIIWI